MPYFDHNATTPLRPESRDAWLRGSTDAWQNPASPYRSAARVRISLDEARRQLAVLVGSTPDRLVFTSGATESCNLAIKGATKMYRDRGNHIVVLAIEHKADGSGEVRVRYRTLEQLDEVCRRLQNG